MGLSLLYSQTNKIIYREDFGKTTERLASQYVPQSGKDNGLGTFPHGSSFYNLANTYFDVSPNPSTITREKANQDIWNIDNGNYAVIAPSSIYNFTKNAPDGSNFWQGSWWGKITNHTDESLDGAVLVVNGGLVLNQYYRRVVELKPNKSYKISAWFYGNGNNNVGVNFEAQDILTETVLGSSNKDLNITNFEGWSNNVMRLEKANNWEQKSWVFKMPASESCTNIAIALRNNVKADGGNDFYVDDIILEEVIDGGNVIDCGSTETIDNIIKANDDSFDLSTGTSIFNLLTNDTYGTDGTTVNLNGVNKNATISTIGEWPEGITLNTETGEITVAPSFVIPTEPLRYQICNLIGVCSSAIITFQNNSSICTQNPTLGTPNGFTNVGISTYSKKNEAWPNNIPNGFISLDSSSKGMVISRTTTANVKFPLEGMIIYDTVDNCVKLYNGTTWNCIKKACNI